MVLCFKKIVVSPIKRNIVRIYFKIIMAQKRDETAKNWTVYIFMFDCYKTSYKFYCVRDTTNLIRKLARKYIFLLC